MQTTCCNNPLYRTILAWALCLNFILIKYYGFACSSKYSNCGRKRWEGVCYKGEIFFLQILAFTMCTLHWLSFAGLVNFFQEICVRTAFEGKHFDMENVALCFCYCNIVNSSNLMNVHYICSSDLFHLLKSFVFRLKCQILS